MRLTPDQMPQNKKSCVLGGWCVILICGSGGAPASFGENANTNEKKYGRPRIASCVFRPPLSLPTPLILTRSITGHFRIFKSRTPVHATTWHTISSVLEEFERPPPAEPTHFFLQPQWDLSWSLKDVHAFVFSIRPLILDGIYRNIVSQSQIALYQSSSNFEDFTNFSCIAQDSHMHVIVSCGTTSITRPPSSLTEVRH
jgi:hypothetical protein